MASIFYLQVFVQKHWHCIPIKIVSPSNLWAFLYEIYLSCLFFYYFFLTCFSFYRIFNMFFGPQCSTTWFHAKTLKLNFDQNSWLLGPIRAFPYEIYQTLSYFSFFSIFFLDLYNLNTSFCSKMPTLHSSQKLWPVGPRVFSYKIYLSFFV